MTKVLFVTQCFPCGSWLCNEKIAKRLSEDGYSIIIAGLGDPETKIPKARYHSVPFFAYTRYGNITCYSPALGFLWNIPLYLLTLIIGIVKNPRAIVYNGLTSGLILAPFFRLIGKKNIIMYHTEVGSQSSGVKNILRFLFKNIDLVVVNSKNSAEDLRDIVSSKKILINEHYADEVFFDATKLKKDNSSLMIAYAGRIDKDKRVFPLIEFAKKMKDRGEYKFVFAGAGADVEKVSSLPKEYKNITYKGYITDKQELAKMFAQADVVWGFADTTYLALPAVESLASDTPVIIPKYAAITNKDEIIDAALVPESAGWLVDPFSPTDIENLIDKIFTTKEYLHKKPRETAKKLYSVKNLLNTVQAIKNLITPN